MGSEAVAARPTRTAARRAATASDPTHRPLAPLAARRQLGAWDGSALRDLSVGVAGGSAELVCKISDSYLGIGDKILNRGADFSTREEVEGLLRADPAYAGKAAVVSELIRPAEGLGLASAGYGAVHSLDIITMRTKGGVKVLSVVFWTDCDGWSSHSCNAGYVVDFASETIVGKTSWYSPHFANMEAPLIGAKVPGVRDACEKAVAAHELSTLGWLTTVGWDAMLTDDGAVFFEGNVAAYRTPRRMFIAPAATLEFLKEFRGEGSPVPP